MKILTLIFITSLCFANFMSEADIIKKNNKERGVTVYVRKGDCKIKEGADCYSIKGKKPRYYKVQLVSIDDPSKPIFASYTNQQECFLTEYDDITGYGENDCRTLTARANTGTFEDPIYEYPLCTDKTYYAMYIDNGDGTYSAQCTKLLSYEQMEVKRLREDATLKAAYLAEQQAVVDAKEERRAEIAAIKADIAKINASDKQPWEKKLLRRLVRELRD